jgi:hypothetical protein
MNTLIKFLSIFALAASVSLVAIGCSDKNKPENNPNADDPNNDTEWVAVEYAEYDRFMWLQIGEDVADNSVMLIRTQEQFETYFKTTETADVDFAKNSILSIPHIKPENGRYLVTTKLAIYRNGDGSIRVDVPTSDTGVDFMLDCAFAYIIPAVTDGAEATMQFVDYEEMADIQKVECEAIHITYNEADYRDRFVIPIRSAGELAAYPELGAQLSEEIDFTQNSLLFIYMATLTGSGEFNLDLYKYNDNDKIHKKYGYDFRTRYCVFVAY